MSYAWTGESPPDSPPPLTTNTGVENIVPAFSLNEPESIENPAEPKCGQIREVPSPNGTSLIAVVRTKLLSGETVEIPVKREFPTVDPPQNTNGSDQVSQFRSPETSQDRGVPPV
eukprot:1881227-Pyramimonas_sp.AAC.1